MAMCVLIIDDDDELVRLLQVSLESYHYRVISAHNGVDGLRIYQEHLPDLVVLDVNLPQMDGLSVCQRLRDMTNVPILIMTASAISEYDIAEGLNRGADEYMIKPLRPIEFLARVRALLRRARLTEAPASNGPDFDDGYLMVDIRNRRVTLQHREVKLTPTEFKLMAMFVKHLGEVLTFSQILELVWGAEYVSEYHYPRIYVAHLRKKIEPDLKNPIYIHSEYGVGYRFMHSQATK
jgi:two-component system KDP operon response regulator KdpE